MRLLIDANIVLDVLQKREGYWKDSSLVWKLCETEQAALRKLRGLSETEPCLLIAKAQEGGDPE